MNAATRIIAVLYFSTAALAGQTQHIASGEVPEGITAKDWGIVQEAYLKASNTDIEDKFGYSVAISGDTIVIGAEYERSSATGVNGSQLDNSAANSGAAYVFFRNGMTWSQQAYLKASNTGSQDLFGSAVAISGDTIVIGAYAEASNATGINGNQADNSTFASGAVYVFVRSGTAWSQQAYLKASNTEIYDGFGYSVAVSGDTIVVGANTEDSNANGINGNQSDNTAESAGAAFVFVRSGTTWSQQAYLKASNSDTMDNFGASVCISGNTIVVGAQEEESNATGVNGNENDNSTGKAGAAYVFVRDGTTWSQQAYLKASNTDASDYFGSAASIAGDTIVIGAVAEDSSATGVNGNQSDNSAAYSGAAYVFIRSGTVWSQQAYLKASNTDSYDYFGKSVSISADTIVVGANGEKGGSTGVNGDQSDNSAAYSGAAYVFARNGTVWSQQSYLKASNTDSQDNFGRSVAISSSSSVIGAPFEESSAIGVNGNQTDNSAGDSGAAYVFTGFGTPGSATITDCSPVPAGMRIEWIPVSGMDSVVKYTLDLTVPFTPLSAALPYPTNSYTDTDNNGKCFYKVDLQP